MEDILKELARQGALTGRHLASGTVGLASAFANPLAYGMNKGLEAAGVEYRFPEQYEAFQNTLTEAGVPEPETTTEKLVGFGAEIGAPDPTDAGKVMSAVQHLFSDPEFVTAAAGMFGRTGNNLGSLGDPSITPQKLETVSTRIPSETAAAKQGIDPHARDDLLVDHTLLSPAKFEKGVDIMRAYPAFRNLSSDPHEAFGVMQDVMSGNLRFVMERMPEKWRDHSMDWYLGYNKIAQDASKKYGTTPEQSGSVIAVLSPQTDWNMNLTRAERILDIYKNRQDFGWSQEMSDTFAKVKKSISQEPYKGKLPNIVGKSLNDLSDPAEKAMWIRTFDEAHNPREFYTYAPDGSRLGFAKTQAGQPKKANWASTGPIEKAVRIIEDGSIENISLQLGDKHKVRSFYRNAADPWEPTTTTMDTHAIATALLMPYGAKTKVVQRGGEEVFSPVAHNFGAGMSDASTGMKGTYALNQAAYNKAAKELGIEGRAVQSPTWDAGRLMFENQKHRGRQHQAEAIWEEFGRGRITLDQARNQIVEAFGFPANPY